MKTCTLVILNAREKEILISDVFFIISKFFVNLMIRLFDKTNWKIPVKIVYACVLCMAQKTIIISLYGGAHVRLCQLTN